MLDGNGQTINNAYNLLDRRAKKEVEWVRDKIGEKFIRTCSYNKIIINGFIDKPS